ncbi:MAG TPA: four helix bundle protein [Bacilli bacterium]|nr:four helix bundle protein [Bacilli bacterium]
MYNLEDLLIYKQYLELIYYTESILVKYPKIEKNNICVQIKNNTYDGMKLIIRAQKSRDTKSRIRVLSELDVSLKMLKVLIRVSKKRKYINIKNYAAWSKKIMNICNLLGGWINSCLKQ